MGLYKLLYLASTPAYPFPVFFRGLEKNPTVKSLFGEKTEEVLRNLKVEFTGIGGYMWINESNGHLMINSHYLKNGDRLEIYLDLIHELVHIRQFLEGVELFDTNYSYVDRPTEIEAYRIAVAEAKKLGMSEERICKYLKTEWMSIDDWKQLARTLHVPCDEQMF